MSIISPIPKLQPKQKVRDWRKLYLEATALVTEQQQINLLPAYGARDAGEILIAESCTEKETIAEALNELESLIDGTPTVLNQFNSFWSCKPIKKRYNELVAFYFVLVNECKEAKIPYNMIIMRYLNFIPGAEKIFNDHKEKIRSTMTAAQMAEVFGDVKKKLTRSQSGENKGFEIQVKQDTEYDNHVFAAVRGKKEEVSYNITKYYSGGLEVTKLNGIVFNDCKNRQKLILFLIYSMRQNEETHFNNETK